MVDDGLNKCKVPQVPLSGSPPKRVAIDWKDVLCAKSKAVW